MIYLVSYLILGLPFLVYQEVKAVEEKHGWRTALFLLAFWVLWIFIAAFMLHQEILRAKYSVKCVWCGAKWFGTSKQERETHMKTHFISACPNHPARQEVLTLRAENERLRGALEYVDKAINNASIFPAKQGLFAEIQDVIRSALKGGDVRKTLDEQGSDYTQKRGDE